WHRGRDRGHQLGVAAVALDAAYEDVRGDGDERRLERGALRGHATRDVAVVGERPVDRVLVRHQTARTVPGSAEQSTSTAVPSSGTPPANSVAMMQGTWYSRLTMPMWLSGVPERQTTAVSSSKIGARNVAPASWTPATTPSADVSMSSSTSSGVWSMRHVPRTGAASSAFVPVPSVSPMTLRDLRRVF